MKAAIQQIKTLKAVTFIEVIIEFIDMSFSFVSHQSTNFC
jgi:hypothetical protein